MSKQTLTMEVQLGKLHVDELECGICEIEVKVTEALETYVQCTYF